MMTYTLNGAPEWQTITQDISSISDEELLPKIAEELCNRLSRKIQEFEVTYKINDSGTCVTCEVKCENDTYFAVAIKNEDSVATVEEMKEIAFNLAMEDAFRAGFLATKNFIRSISDIANTIGGFQQRFAELLEPPAIRCKNGIVASSGKR